MDVGALRKAIRIWVFKEAFNIDDYDEPEPEVKKDEKKEKKVKTGNGLLGGEK